MKIPPLIATGLLLFGCSSNPPAGLADILNKNANARGGKDALESVYALRLEVSIEEPTFALTGTYVATRGGRVRVDVFDGKQRVFTEALGPTGGWQWFAGEEQTHPLSPEGLAALRRGLIGNLYAIYEWQDHGYRLALEEPVGPEPRHWIIVATEPDGFEKRIWIDRKSHLTTRVYETSALHPDMDATKTSQYSMPVAWEWVSGILVPKSTRKLDVGTGETIQDAVVTAWELVDRETDPRPDWTLDSYFERPRFRGRPAPSPDAAPE